MRDQDAQPSARAVDSDAPLWIAGQELLELASCVVFALSLGRSRGLVEQLLEEVRNGLTGPYRRKVQINEHDPSSAQHERAVRVLRDGSDQISFRVCESLLDIFPEWHRAVGVAAALGAAQEIAKNSCCGGSRRLVRVFLALVGPSPAGKGC